MFPINEQIEILDDALETARQTGCKVYHGACENCVFCIEGETEGYMCGIAKMQTILDAIVDNKLIHNATYK